jgi:uncharacterized protein YjbI with pentapeptide repeats
MIRRGESIPMQDAITIKRRRLWFDCAQLIVALFVPLTIIVYTVIQNNTEMSIARENRLQDLKIADERHRHDVILSNDQQEETTLVRYFDSLGKLLEKNDKLVNETNIARFKTLTALAQLKSKRKGFLIRSLIENKLIIINGGQNPILDLSLADLTGLDLTNNMLVNDEMRCVVLSQTTLTNASFRGMTIRGSSFQQSLLINSDFSSTFTDPWSCGSIISGVNFRETILDNSNFDHSKHQRSSFAESSLIRARMRYFSCSECTFLRANMHSMDLTGAEFSSESITKSNFLMQSVNMSYAILHKTKFFNTDFAQATLTMINATETIFNTSIFSFTSLEYSSFVQTTIHKSSFDYAKLKGSLWYQSKISYTSFLKADLSNVQFINSECYYCIFNQTKLTNTNFTNSLLDGSDFRETNITYQQLLVARSLRNVTLPNGIIL